MIPRTAFCFHDANPTGATLWLQRFLQALPEEVNRRALAILPARSTVEEALEGSGIPCDIVPLISGDLKGARGAQALALGFNRAAAVPRYVAAFRRQRVKAVYVNSSYQIAPMLAAAALRLPLIVHVHEGWNSGRTHALKRAIIRSQADVVICAARDGIRLFGPPARGQRWEVSPNGVDRKLAEARQQRTTARESLSIEGDAPVLLFLGSLTKRKGFHDLLGVWPRLRRRHPGARLLVGGLADPLETNPAIASFTANPPEGAVPLGFVQDVAPLLAAADVFVLPSYAEAMPVSVSEAMMAGCPVVARAVADVPWQMGEGRGFLFHGKGPRPLYEALDEALRHPELAKRRAQAAQAFARENLTREQQQRQILELIEHAVQARRFAPKSLRLTRR